MRCYILLTNILVLSLIALIFGGNVRDRICNRLLPKNRVGRQDYLDHIATGEEFLVIYSVLVNTGIFSQYAKARRIFNASGDYNALARLTADFPDECFGIGVLGFNVTEVTEVRKAGKCRRRDTYFRMGADDERIKTRYFSQDLSKYFWWFECENGGTVNSYESCTGTSALELHIKDTRCPPTLNAELNLTTFPWDLALQDLKDFTGLTFSDPRMEYKWLGDECGESGGLSAQNPFGSWVA